MRSLACKYSLRASVTPWASTVILSSCRFARVIAASLSPSTFQIQSDSAKSFRKGLCAHTFSATDLPLIVFLSPYSEDADLNNFSQQIPAEWTKALTCDEEGFFQNPNDCHKFYRCYKSGNRFARTLFDCKPKNLVFDALQKVCVSVDEGGFDNVCGVLAGESADY